MKQKFFGPGITPGVDVYVGIDQSYSGFGLCFLGVDGSYQVSVTAFGTSGVTRLVDVQSHILKSFMDAPHGKVLDVAMEGYAYGSQMANMAGELGATVKLILFTAFGVYPLIVPPTSLKKFVTGKGNGVKKSQIMLAVYKKWGIELLDDNAADAYALARIAEGKPTSAYQEDVLTKLNEPQHRENKNGTRI